MWFPSRTGGALSPKSNLRDVYKIVQKKSQKGSEKVPQKCSKRYVYCGFFHFTTFPIYSKKAPKRFRKGSQNDYERVPKTTKMWCPKRSKIWFPSRTGGTLSQTSDLRKASIINNDPKNVPKRFPKKWQKRYAHCRFGDFRDPQNLFGTPRFICLKVPETLHILSFRWFGTK